MREAIGTFVFPPIWLLSAHGVTGNGEGSASVQIRISQRPQGWATPDNPLNRPGWHCDGFGTNDMNYVWWNGPGTRFTLAEFHDVSSDHVRSMQQFDEQAERDPRHVYSPPVGNLYALTPSVVHATPIIGAPGCMRQYVKVSLSDERYNLENNSHSYMFDYDWPLHSRDAVRNDPHKAQKDTPRLPTTTTTPRSPSARSCIAGIAKWAGETTNRLVYTGACPECLSWGLSYIRFHEYEKVQANDVLERDIGKSVDDVKPYEDT